MSAAVASQRSTGPRAAAPLGTLSLVALVVGNMIGSGTFLLPSALAPFGLSSLWGWGLSTLGALLLALVFARMALRLRGSGGPHHYALAVFGPQAGALVAWCYWVSCWCGVAAIAIAFAGSLGALLPGLGDRPLQAALSAGGAIVVCTACNLLGLRAGSALQTLTAALKLLPLLLLGLLGWFWFDPQLAATPAAASTPSAWLATTTSVATLTLWAFLGLECATVPAGAVRDPQRSVPRATVIGTLLAALASVLACTVVLGLVPATQLARDGAPLSSAARAIWGHPAGVLMSLAAVIACLGAVNGWILVQAQVAAAAARDGLFPHWLGTASAQSTPRRGLLLGGGLALLLVLANFREELVRIYTFSVLLSTAACLLPFLVVALAAWRRADTVWQRGIAALAALFSLAALLGTGSEALLWGLVLLVAGVPLLWGLAARRRRATA